MFVIINEQIKYVIVKGARMKKKFLSLMIASLVLLGAGFSVQCYAADYNVKHHKEVRHHKFEKNKPVIKHKPPVKKHEKIRKDKDKKSFDKHKPGFEKKQIHKKEIKKFENQKRK